MRGQKRRAREDAGEGLGKQLADGSRERDQRKMVLYAWPRMGLEVGGVGMRGRLQPPASSCCLPFVPCNPDCTLWYLEIPVSQTKTFVWVNILSPKM